MDGHSANLTLIKKDLLTLSDQDLKILYKYYNTCNINVVINKIYSKKAFLPEGTIFDAVKNKNFENFMEFLNDPAFQVDNVDNEGRSILFYVVSKDEKYLDALLKKNPNINLQSNHQKTALMTAVQKTGNTAYKPGDYIPSDINIYQYQLSSNAIVKKLIKAGANLDLQSNIGWTALMYSSQNDNSLPSSTTETLDILVKAGADLNKRDLSGKTVLMFAVDTTNTTIESLHILIEAGADLDLQDFGGDTALSFCINPVSDFESAKILIDAGADVNKQNSDGNTILMRAINIYFRNLKRTDKYKDKYLEKILNLIKILIKKSDLNLKNNLQQTPLDLAHNDIELQLELLDSGAIIKDETKYRSVIELKINLLYNLLNELRKDLTEDEKEYLYSLQKCKFVSGLQGIQNLKECIEMVNKMIKLRPGGEKYRKKAEKYENIMVKKL